MSRLEGWGWLRKASREYRCDPFSLLNVEYRTAEQGTAEVCNDYFDIRYSLFDILRFKVPARESGYPVDSI
jgi:hypothetical protein